MPEGDGFHYEGEISWCPGCGDFQILKSLEKALVDAGKKPWEVLLVSGIGQAAKLPHYIRTNGFNGLHGRALPPAFGAKAVNPELEVVVTSGDGDMYGEGGNHFIHAIRRNPDITVIVHNNQIYGLTKGQASPTSDKGMVTGTQPEGVINEPFNPLTVAISLGAPFVARTFSKDIDYTAHIIGQAMAAPGFALVDVLQPCVSFNKINTYKWYGERVYKLEDEGHDPSDRMQAYGLAMEWSERIPIGVFYRSEKPTWAQAAGWSRAEPAIRAEVDRETVENMLEAFY